MHIASDVPLRQGAVAWSPDGGRIAFLGKGLTLFDVASGSSTPVPVNDAQALAWAADGTLYAVIRDGDTCAVAVIGGAGGAFDTIPLPSAVDALHVSHDGRRLYLLSLRTRDMQIGTSITTAVSVLDLRTRAVSELHGLTTIYPARGLKTDLLSAWFGGGLNSLDHSLLVMELVKPPALPPYTRLLAIDDADGNALELGDRDARRIYLSAAWSPDGERLLLTTDRGMPVLLSPGGGQTPLAGLPSGLVPSWSLNGGIYIGGAVAAADNTVAAHLLRDAGMSIGFWSPDGSLLAVIDRGDLLLFRGFRPSAGSGAAPLDRGRSERLGQLQDLLRLDLITREEYRERRKGLLSHGGFVP